MTARPSATQPEPTGAVPMFVRLTPLIPATCIATCLIAAGCGGGPAHGPGPQDFATSAVAGLSGRGEPGLEVVAWSTDAPLAMLAGALAMHARDGGSAISPEAAALWSSHGLRVYRVPVARLEELRVEMGAPPRAVRNWLGQALTWTEAVGGAEQRAGQTIALEAERLRLGAGRLRLLVRSWIAPIPTDSGAAGLMHIELLPQHQEADRPAPGDMLLGAPSIAAADQGMLFTRLWLRERVTNDDDALVIIAAPPLSDFQQLAASMPRAETGAGGAAPGVGEVVRARDTAGTANAEAPAPRSSGGIGPPAASIPTLGEAMLVSTVHAPRAPATSDAAAEQAALRPPVTRRLVVALVPRLPEGYTLLP